MAQPMKVHAKDHESYNTFSILGLLLPWIGIILGIVYLTKNEQLERKLGEHLIVISIFGFILLYLIRLVLIMNAQGV